jgi:RNA polymerase sigma-70 factor, ECF subfamily
MTPQLRLLRSDGDAAKSASAVSDEELVRRLVAGEDRAAVLVWRAYSTTVRGLVVRALGPTVDIEDLVQDVFSVFFRKVSSLKDPSALRPFLIGIAIREIRSELRRRKIRNWLQLTATGDLGEYFASGDENARHAFARFHRVLECLDARGHLAFVLRHVEGHELLEIAEALSCSLATVKRVLSAAEVKVREAAAKDPYLAAYIEPATVGG